jgi:twinkle protein
LEESVAKTTLGFMSFAAGFPLHKVLQHTPEADLRRYWEEATRGDRFILLDSRGWGSNIDILKSRIRFMAKAMGCRWIILDHLTIALSSVEGASSDWSAIDELMTDLVNLVHELDIGLHLVSHVSEGRNLRGSKGIAKLADAVIYLERDKHEENPELRDITKVIVDKNRFAGDTGTGCYLKYSRATGRMSECPTPTGSSAETEF